MNFTQMHERLRLELLRRVERGTVSVSLLARQTGLAQAHVSNFLRGRRRLSLRALDTVLTAQQLEAIDLLPSFVRSLSGAARGELTLAPMVSQGAALFEPFVRAGARQGQFPIQTHFLEALRPRCASARRRWERFVAYRVPPPEAPPMEPLLTAGVAVLIDRHYTSLQAYRPNHNNLYAVRLDERVALRFVEIQANCLILRPYRANYPIDLIEQPTAELVSERIAGRVALVVNEF